MIFRTTSFTLTTAKKIQNGYLQGEIKTEDGKSVRIISTDIIGSYRLAVAVLFLNEEKVFFYNEQGICQNSTPEETSLNLVLEVPYDYTEYDGFLPKQYQACMVKMYNTYTKLHSWTIAVCATLNNGEPTFFQTYESDVVYYTNVVGEFLPLNETTLKLYGTTKSYEQLFV